MTVGALVQEKGGEVVSVRPNQPVSEIIAILVSRRIGTVLVLDGDSIAGILSERDVVRCLGDRGEGILSEPASSLMTAEVITVTPHETITAAMGRMTRRRIRHLPVVENGKLMGIVSIGDLVKRRIEDIEREAESLKDYIQHA